MTHNKSFESYWSDFSRNIYPGKKELQEFDFSECTMRVLESRLKFQLFKIKTKDLVS